jgi:hypothetical protein
MAIDIRLNVDTTRKYALTFSDPTRTTPDTRERLLTAQEAQLLLDCCHILSVSAQSIIIQTSAGTATIASRYQTSQSPFTLA